ncbi:MAG: quinoprotein dehydrogenase-associated putative ABC transporter substrate-binding protein [Gammaproteobacteria bacterium]|nr:quinoprotein dehydrogenase-associated putative ABC transporter substrate-binding protein [Gammaproteobacteria bacterium]
MLSLPKIRGRIRLLTAMMSGVFALSVSAAEPPSPPRTAFKVCAPPYSLPMSDKDESGYENKIAQLFAKDLGLPLQYTWFPQRMGFVRATLKNNETEDGSYKCDIVMGVVDNFDLAATTRPYLRSSWALVYFKGRGLDFIKSQDDLKHLTAAQKKLLRIGVWDQGPTTDWVYKLGLMDNATPFPIMSGDARQGPGHIIEEDLKQDKINLTFVWGPIGGYLAHKIKDAELIVIPLQKDQGVKFDFQIAMAVRHPDTAWKKQINDLIGKHQAKITSILDEYGVPQLELLPPKKKSTNDD